MGLLEIMAIGLLFGFTWAYNSWKTDYIRDTNAKIDNLKEDVKHHKQCYGEKLNAITKYLGIEYKSEAYLKERIGIFGLTFEDAKKRIVAKKITKKSKKK